jgi:hypothetical protein
MGYSVQEGSGRNPGLLGGGSWQVGGVLFSVIQSSYSVSVQ